MTQKEGLIFERFKLIAIIIITLVFLSQFLIGENMPLSFVLGILFIALGFILPIAVRVAVKQVTKKSENLKTSVRDVLEEHLFIYDSFEMLSSGFLIIYPVVAYDMAKGLFEPGINTTHVLAGIAGQLMFYFASFPLVLSLTRLLINILKTSPEYKHEPIFEYFENFKAIRIQINNLATLPIAISIYLWLEGKYAYSLIAFIMFIPLFVIFTKTLAKLSDTNGT